MDTRSPSKEGPRRCHLGAGTEERDIDAAQIKPVRVVHEGVNRLGETRFGNPVAHPAVDLGAEVITEESLALIRNRQVALCSDPAFDRDGPEPGLGGIVHRRTQGLLAAGTDESKPAMR